MGVDRLYGGGEVNTNVGAVFFPNRLWQDLYGYVVQQWAQEIPTNFTFKGMYSEYLISFEHTPYQYLSLLDQRELIKLWRTNLEEAKHANIRNILPENSIWEQVLRLTSEAEADLETVLALAPDWQGDWLSLLEASRLVTR